MTLLEQAQQILQALQALPSPGPLERDATLRARLLVRALGQCHVRHATDAAAIAEAKASAAVALARRTASGA